MLTGKSVSLNPFDRRHLNATRAWANDADLMRVLNRAFPISDYEHEGWYERLAANKNKLVIFSIERNSDSRHVGNVWLWDIDPRHRKAELSIMIGDRTAHGRGLGTEAISLIVRYGFNYLNLHKIYAHVLGTNPRARKAFEKAGFHLEGTLKKDRWSGKRYVDAHLLAILA